MLKAVRATEPRSARRRGAAALCLCAALALAGPLAPAQTLPARECRAVWLTTLSGLDWPSAATRGNPEAQQRELRVILDNLVARNINTVYFQARSRGNAFYRSAIEPWAAELSGSFGTDPGWDPLAFAISEAHARGLELHAWVNVFKVWSGGASPPRSTPPHIAHASPTWATEYKGEQWIDPGIPEAREWLVRLFSDIALRYDLDAIHLDYARYPEADFDDAATYRRLGRGTERAAWRRANVDAFVEELSARLRALKPRLRLGAAPIGIYESIPDARGWQGYHALGQDSRGWLRKGLVDYLAPQIYWGLKRRGSNVDFDALIHDWQRASSGRTIIAGMAPYKDDVRPWIGDMIDVSRAAGAAGQAYFRYEHVRDGSAFAGRYETRILPPAAPWRDPVRPNPPTALRVERGDGAATLTWRSPAPAADGETVTRSAVYRMERDAAAAPVLLAVLPEGVTQYRDTQRATEAEYVVTALDRCNNESDACSSAFIAGRARTPSPSHARTAPRLAEPVFHGERLLLVAYQLPAPADMRLRLMDGDGAELAVLVEGRIDAGTHMLGLDLDRLPPRAARLVFETGETTQLRELTSAP